jgi:RND family efflux transporter MFP subunit
MRREKICNVFFSTVLCAASLCVSGEEKKKGGPPAMPQRPPAIVSVETVKPITQTLVKEYIGNIETVEEVDLQPRISGFITDIKFKEGSLVKKGDLLFTIEDTSYKAKFQAAQALLEQAKAELSYAQSNYTRQKRLSVKDAVSLSNFEDAERLMNLKRAVYAQREAELMEAENELSYTKIYAPISGRIGKVEYTRGNYVSLNSSPLAKIVCVDPIRVKFALSERVFQNLFASIKELNPHVNIELKLSSGEKYGQKGEVDFVDNVVDDHTDTISVWVKYPNKDMRLIPGGYVIALVSEKDIKPLPGITVSGVITDNKGNYVYVLGPGNIPERRDVEVGEMIGGVYTITKGLKLGEVVIVDGTHKVIPGAPVNPMPLVNKASGK